MLYCIYCGDFAECRDHLIPVSYNQCYRDYKRNATVPACNECNGLLSNLAFHTIESRTDYLLQKYQERLSKILSPVWSEDELSEIASNLKTKILQRQSKQQVYQQKIDNLSAPKPKAEVSPVQQVILPPILKKQLNFCKFCGEEILRRNSHAKYCSNLCKNSLYRATQSSTVSFSHEMAS